MAESSTPAAQKPRKPRHVRRATPPMLWGKNQPVLKESEEVETDQILPILPEPAFVPRERQNDEVTAATKAKPEVPSGGIWVYPDEDLLEAFCNRDMTVKRSSQPWPVGSRPFPRAASPHLLPTYRGRMSDLAQHQKSEGRKWLLRFLCFPPLLLFLGHGLADEFLQWQTFNHVTTFGDAEKKLALFLGYGIFLASVMFAIIGCTFLFLCKFVCLFFLFFLFSYQ